VGGGRTNGITGTGDLVYGISDHGTYWNPATITANPLMANKALPLGADGLPLTSDDGWLPKNALAKEYGPRIDFDQDDDGLDDSVEIIITNTDPNDRDSDDDGVWDGTEIQLDTDPNDPFDFPLLGVEGHVQHSLLAAGIAVVAAIALRDRSIFRLRRR
jgi:hypothetical protein